MLKTCFYYIVPIFVNKYLFSRTFTVACKTKTNPKEIFYVLEVIPYKTGKTFVCIKSYKRSYLVCNILLLLFCSLLYI